MGIIRFLKRLAIFGAGLFCATFLAVTLWSFAWPDYASGDVPVADAIMCLGGDIEGDSTIGDYSRQRAQTCIDLYYDAKAPLIIFTGAGDDQVSVAENMAELARVQGVPHAAIIEERAARSTLQNALFSLAFLKTNPSIILVTDSFHLPRSWASYRWAGYGDMTMVASGATFDSDWLGPKPEQLVRESLAIWFNLFRGTLWSGANFLGVENTVWLM